MKTILRGNIICAPEFGHLRTLPRGFLVLEDGVVSGLYDNLPDRLSGETVEDYGDCLILQSFADLHLHAPQYPMLGMGMDLPLLDWLNTYTFKTESRFADTDYARGVYRQLAQTLICGGTTRVAMFSSCHTDATLILMEELEKAGVTGCVGRVNMDRNCSGTEEETGQSLSETLRWLENCRFPHIQPILTPRFTPACTDELMAQLGQLAQQLQLPVQSHLSENSSEIAWVSQLHPDCRRYWESYQKFGLWGERTLMAHCVHSDKAEQQAMARFGVTAVHCAASNINLCSGIAPVRKMLDGGVKVALGSDIAGGDQLQMNRVITMAIQTSKIRQISHGDPFLTVPEAYYLGTGAGHRFFGAGDGFSVGDRLHAIVVDDSSFARSTHPRSLEERLERALYRMLPEHILVVYSDGRRVLDRRKNAG